MRRVEETVFNGAQAHAWAYSEHGTLDTEPVKIQLRNDAQLYAVHAARHVPLPMLPKVKGELERMERHGVIEKVTEWCAPMVPVLKRATGKARICVDFKRLNEAVKREQYILPMTGEITAKLSGATLYLTGRRQRVFPDTATPR